MQLPNKLYSYKNSTMALTPKVLSEIKDSPVPVFENLSAQAKIYAAGFVNWK